MSRRTRLNEYRDYSNSEIDAAISEWIHSERDRVILREKLLCDITYEAIAERHKLDVSTVKRIVYRSRDRLFRKLK